MRTLVRYDMRVCENVCYNKSGIRGKPGVLPSHQRVKHGTTFMSMCGGM
jgi:hypothetical protein